MIVAVTNAKGGTGKTTTSMGLAAAAVERGMGAVVHDADPQASASRWAWSAEEIGEDLGHEVVGVLPPAIARIRDDGRLHVIDCPPAGAAIKEAMARADFVVIPATPGPTDLQQTYEASDAAEELGKPYAVLLCRADKRTTAYRDIVAALDAEERTGFEDPVPDRQEINRWYGHRLAGGNLFGYDEVLNDILEAIG